MVDATGNKIDKLSLTLLGPVEVRLGKKKLTTFGSRKAQALLFYLAMNPGSCAREILAALLWPEMNDKKAKSNLRVAIASLKQQIGPYLESTPSHIALNRQLPYTLDAESFQSSLLEALKQHNIEKMRTAVTLYGGEFIQGFYLANAGPFEEWVLQQRECLRMLVIQALEAVTADCLEHDEYTLGLSAARRLLRIEPWHEEAHRTIMQLLTLSNQRTAALAQYELCQRLLEAELGVGPAPETIALYEAIKGGQYEKVRSKPTTRHHAPPPTPDRPEAADASITIPTNLEAVLINFVGRERELEHISQHFTAGQGRLYCILGPGGMGKSSLAHQAARRMTQTHQHIFPDGIYLLRLPGGSQPADAAEAKSVIITAIAQVVGCELHGNPPSHMQLHTFLNQRQLLLVIDNFEHFVAGVNTLVEILAHAPNVQMLITSRTRLRVSGETILPLEKLSLPRGPLQPLPSVAIAQGAARPPSWRESEAVTMFMERAKAIHRDFVVSQESLDAIVKICNLVDGLPLGIEMAASWLHVLPCHQIAQEIEQSLDFLTDNMCGLPDSQRTLRSIFDSSWSMLGPDEQALLVRLSIFPSTFQCEAARAITNTTVHSVATLLNHSLLSLVNRGRYNMHRCIREFVLDKLMQQPDIRTELRIRFARYFLEFAAQKEESVKGSKYRKALEQISAELENIRTAWDWAIELHMFAEIHQSLEVLMIAYEQLGLFREGVKMLLRTIEEVESHSQLSSCASDSPEKLLLSRLYTMAGWYYARLGQGDRVEGAFQSSLQVLRHSGRQEQEPWAHLLFYWGLALGSYFPKRTVALLDESVRLLARLGDRWRLPIAWSVLSTSYLLMGSYGKADSCCRESERLAHEQGGPFGFELALLTLGRIEIARGHFEVAAGFLQASHEFAQKGSLKPLLTMSLMWLGEINRLQGRVHQAQLYYEQSRELAKSINHTLAVAASLWGSGCLADGQGNYKEAKNYFLQSQALTNRAQWIHLQPTLGWTLLQLGEVNAAKHYFRQVAERAEQSDILPTLLDARAGLAYIEQLQGLGVSFDQILRHIYQHSAATQETRSRVDHILRNQDRIATTVTGTV